MIGVVSVSKYESKESRAMVLKTAGIEMADVQSLLLVIGNLVVQGIAP